jgi:hypothetical protein
MDTVIQGLTQSSIVQKLSETPHNVKRFTNDIPDNAPYRSTSKLVLAPYTGDRTAPESIIRFRIERSGYLNRTFLRVRFKSTTPPDSTLARTSSDDSTKPIGPSFFASFFERASLFVGGKRVETLYPESIMYKVCQSSLGVGENMLYGLKGAFRNVGLGGNYFGEGGNSAVGNALHEKFGDFIIPLDFSFFQFFKDSSYMTFLPRIETEVVTKTVGQWQDGVGSNQTAMDLVCKYHNLHSHFKNQIRNLSHPEQTKSLILSDSYRVDTQAQVTQFDNPTPVPGGRYASAKIKLDHLDFFVTDILITFRKSQELISFESDNYGSIVTSPSSAHYTRFILRGDDRVLFDKYHYEMYDHKQNVSNLDIQDRYDDAAIGRLYDRNEEIHTRTTAGSLEYAVGGFPGVDHYSNMPMYRIPLSMFSSDEFLSGGLDLSSLTNVELIIEGEPYLPLDPDPNSRRALVAEVILRHKRILRVDGKNGVVG